MMKTWLIGLIGLSLLLLGGCSSNPPIPAPNECVPDIQIVEQYVPFPPELTELHEAPAVPSSGDNAALLDWAMACGAQNHLYEQQIRALKELQ